MNPRSRPLVSLVACLVLAKLAAGCQSSSHSADPGPPAGQGGQDPAGAGQAGNAGFAAQGGAGAAGEAGAAGKPLAECPAGAPGPAMVLIPTPEGNYCIDSTEVTQTQYADFLASKPQASEQSNAWCQKMNQSYEPKYQDDVGQGNCLPGAVDLKTKGDWPMVCVDWCDAFAYCAWAGKRLCGSRQGGGLKLTDDPSSLQSQWNYACTNGGTTKYPYGDELDNNKCASATIVSTNEQPECHGLKAPFAQVKNLVGNSDEWEDNCNDAPIARDCTIRSNAGNKPCSQIGQASASQQSPGVGFRCCAD